MQRGGRRVTTIRQCVAVCCSVLQCVAVCGWHPTYAARRQASDYHTTATRKRSLICCRVLQWLHHVAPCCTVLHRVAVCCAVCCSVLQCVAVCCKDTIRSIHSGTQKKQPGVLQCVAVCCSVLQCVADTLHMQRGGRRLATIRTWLHHRRASRRRHLVLVNR